VDYFIIFKLKEYADKKKLNNYEKMTNSFYQLNFSKKKKELCKLFFI